MVGSDTAINAVTRTRHLQVSSLDQALEGDEHGRTGISIVLESDCIRRHESAARDRGEGHVRGCPGVYSMHHAVPFEEPRYGIPRCVLRRRAQHTAIHWRRVLELTVLGAHES